MAGMRIAFSDSNREDRRILNRHLLSMHGQTILSTLGKTLTVEQMEKFHELLHFDDYACPPHDHDAVTGEVEMTYDDDYLQGLIKMISERDEE
jgi:hypothetical protein